MSESERLDPGLRAAFGPQSAAPPASVLARLNAGGVDLSPVRLWDDQAEAETPLSSRSPRMRAPDDGRYEVLGEIARGGVGVILKGHDTDLGRDVAMKVLREEHVARPEVFQRFVEEAQIGGQLQHPGIVPVYELGLSADRRPFFTMKLVNGRTLAALLRERKSPAVERWRFVSVFGAVCQTMAYAHARGVVHRDLKPANVMVGSFGEVLVVDWGMGKVLRHAGAGIEQLAAPVTKEIETVRSGPGCMPSIAGSLMGTPAYMPPEQARGDIASVDKRSDVFALGAILCEILTGSPPYTGDAMALLARASLGDPAGVSRRLEACGAEAELIRIATACLAPAPSERPADASVVATQISAFLASVEERAHRARIESAATKARARVLLLGGVALCASLALGVVATTWQARRASAAANLASAEADRARLALTVVSDISRPSRRFGRGLTPLQMTDYIARRAKRLFTDDPRFEADMRFLLGDDYFNLGQPERGELNLRLALDLRAGQLEPDDPLTLQCAYTLARHLVFQGRLREAEQLATGAIDALRRRGTPEDDEHLLAAQAALSFVYHMRGRCAENEALCRSIMENSTQLTDSSIDVSYHWMRALVELNRFDEAEALARDRLRASEVQVAGSVADVDWQAWVVLARCARGRDDEEGAGQILQEAYVRNQRLHGDEDVGTTFLLEELGLSQTLSRRYREAEDSYRRALEQAPLQFGAPFGQLDDERHLAWALLRQAKELVLPESERQAKLADVDRIHRRMIAICSGTPGPDPEFLYLEQNQYAWFLYEYGRAAEAEPVARDAVAGYRTIEAGRDGNKVAAFDTLAVLQRDRGALEEAERLFREALDFAVQVPPDNPTLVPEVQVHLGVLCVLAGRWGEGESILREAYRALEELPSRDPNLWRSNMERSIEDCEARNDQEHADQLRRLLEELR
jgi:tetratricopeptide (TPR) repeat protein